jgi:hypothetical protein
MHGLQWDYFLIPATTREGGYAYANGFVVLTEGPDMFGLRAIATDGKNNPEGMGSPWLKASAACGNPGPSLKTTGR